ncbi:MAG: exonuclease SbcCD subunit D [Candidatus Thermoplasmatota archaeon]|nr:exonuclease SbcCD subunit D [Candidatus Thermoplasmatota archaeon]
MPSKSIFDFSNSGDAAKNEETKEKKAPREKHKREAPRSAAAHKHEISKSKIAQPPAPVPPKKEGTIRFAHLADCHLGAFRDDTLRELNIKAFENAIDKSVAEGADFIIIAGDLFHTNVPDMRVAERCARKLRHLKEKGIEVFVLYGSHDYSPNEKSIIDVLKGAGLFNKLGGGEYVGDKLKLKPSEFRGIPIIGLLARTSGLEKSDYEHLDTEALEALPNPKIFVYHSAIAEYRPSFLKDAECVPLSLFPKGFAYYAGGHVHERREVDERGYGTFVFPGHTFGADFRDLESDAEEAPGFYIVDIESGAINLHFVPVEIPEIMLADFKADGKGALEFKEELQHWANGGNFAGKIVMLRVAGKLASGKPNEVELEKIRETVLEKGALVCVLNRGSLSSAERLAVQIDTSKSKDEIEREIIGEFVSKASFKDDALNGKKGAELAISLSGALKQEQRANETKDTYHRRVFGDVRKVMDSAEGQK